MKKTFALVLTAALLILALVACQSTPAASAPAPSAPSSSVPASSSAAPAPAPSSSPPAAENVNIRIAGLRGPTSMGLVKVMEDNETGKAANDYTFTIAGSADELTPKLIQGQLDIAAVPANLASVLYNNTDGKIKLLAVNTLGVMYIVEKGDTIQTMADLKGKTIYATGKGSTPEYALRYLLQESGVNPDTDVTIEWKSEPTETVALLKQNGGIALMPQPYVTIAQGQVDGLRIAVDLTEVWDGLKNGSTLITGVLAVRSDFAEKYPEQLAAFLDEYKSSTEYVNANIPEAAKLIEKFDIVKAAIAEKAIPYCYITFMEGAEMKASMGGYLQVLFDQNPKSIGGKLPGDDIYYAR
jgi:NitT/TauT family transport system substrate-binding protein